MNLLAALGAHGFGHAGLPPRLICNVLDGRALGEALFVDARGVEEFIVDDGGG